MESKLTRRRFLFYGATGAALVAAAYCGGWYWLKVRQGDTEDLVVSVLRRHLKGLPVAEVDMRNFARSLQKRYSKHRRLAMLGMLGPIYERVDIISPLPNTRRSFRRFEDTVVGEFLLSTDFFDTDADTSEQISYFGPYSTYSRICSNPFAVLDEE
jgi:hypothetical protein